MNLNQSMLAAFALFATVLTAAEPSKQAAPVPDMPVIAALVKALGAEKFSTRDAAQHWLARMGTRVYPALKKIREQTIDPEVGIRLDWLMEYNRPLEAVVNNQRVRARMPRDGVGAFIMFDAFPSVKANDVEKLSFYWKQTAGPRLRRNANAIETVVLRFYAPTPGRYAFNLVITDGRRTSEPLEVEAIVEPPAGATAVTGLISVPHALQPVFGRTVRPAIATPYLFSVINFEYIVLDGVEYIRNREEVSRINGLADPEIFETIEWPAEGVAVQLGNGAWVVVDRAVEIGGWDNIDESEE